ncbi:MAG: rod shape-determining protein MreC [Flavobacteriales bacterium]|nr:rod shape-determining protein MreC [Flavobacteriales bacterium]
MLHLFELLRKYKYALSFVILQLISFVFLFNTQVFHKFSFLNSSNYLVGSTYAVSSSINNYFNLKSRNVHLQDQNSQLLEQNHQLKELLFETGKNITIDTTDFTSVFQYLPAKVVNFTQHNKNVFLTINKGANDGIKKDMGVIGAKGIIGKTIYISNQYSIVMTCLHQDFYTNIEIGKEKVIGSLSWNGNDNTTCQIGSVSKYAKVQEGDSVFTNQLSSIFPKDIFIGQVSKVSINPDDQFFQIEVALGQNIKEAYHVYFLMDIDREEKQSLEDSIYVK